MFQSIRECTQHFQSRASKHFVKVSARCHDSSSWAFSEWNCLRSFATSNTELLICQGRINYNECVTMEMRSCLSLDPGIVANKRESHCLRTARVSIFIITLISPRCRSHPSLGRGKQTKSFLIMLQLLFSDMRGEINKTKDASFCQHIRFRYWAIHLL